MVGVIAICIETGETVYVKSKATIFATGGAGRIYASTTNAHINTGDGMGMALRAGAPAQDMEMWQFHQRAFMEPARWSPKGVVGGRIPHQQGWRTLYGAIRA